MLDQQILNNTFTWYFFKIFYTISFYYSVYIFINFLHLPSAFRIMLFNLYHKICFFSTNFYMFTNLFYIILNNLASKNVQLKVTHFNYLFSFSSILSLFSDVAFFLFFKTIIIITTILIIITINIINTIPTIPNTENTFFVIFFAPI